MTINRAALATGLCLIAFGMVEGTTSLRAMVNTYSNACGPMDGVQGLLQKAGFIPVGKCDAILQGKCREGACVIRGNRGHCILVKQVKKPFCACEPDIVSH